MKKNKVRDYRRDDGLREVSEDQGDPLIVKAGGVVGGILGGVITGAVTRNPQAAIEGAITGYAVGTATTWAAISFSWKVYAIYRGIDGIPGDVDNNAVVGG
ncbi:hypothetical protein [Thermococcus sp.]|uniref:hypothetical protein n=1 Tax=Thermococcus sp. TaxID=35749 RepID=UPI002618824C|nr:hypothetical protein [Thermococcus sp.]